MLNDLLEFILTEVGYYDVEESKEDIKNINYSTKNITETIDV